MSKKRKANITPEDVGNYYTDGKEIYKLMSCETEPSATMLKLGANPENETASISAFANFVRLVPEREIPKPDTPRKERIDKGKTHRKVKPGKIDIEKIGLAVAHDDQPAWATYKDIAASNPTIKGAVLDLFVGLGIAGAEKVIEYIKAQPDSPNKTILINALGG